MEGNVALMVAKYIQSFVIKREGVRPFETHRRRWKAIEMDVKEIGCEGVDWTNMVLVRGSGGLLWNFRVPMK